MPTQKKDTDQDTSRNPSTTVETTDDSSLVSMAAWGGSNDPTETMTMLKLGWFRMVARCWRDPTYAGLLLKMNPDQLRNEFATGYHVSLPPDLDVTVKQKEGNDIWDPRNQTWRFGTSAELALYLPHAPKPLEGFTPHSDDAVAITKYAWNGRNYPFSCCC